MKVMTLSSVSRIDTAALREKRQTNWRPLVSNHLGDESKGLAFLLLRTIAFCFFVASIVLGSEALARPIWDGDNATTASEPENRRGGNPSYANAPWNPKLGTTGAQLEDDGGALSGNYRLSLPILKFPGRGNGLQLTMHYSSQLWAQLSDQTMAFDPDSDWPSPGWSIGFGKLILTSNLGHNGFLPSVLIGSDHTRQDLLQQPPYVERVRHMRVAGDSLTNVTICCFGTGEDQGTTATLTNGQGQTVEYFTLSPGDNQAVYYPSRLIDANGNYVSIAYIKDASGRLAPPAIDIITDTVGRIVQFHYDPTQRLVAISAPGLEDERRVYAQFLYLIRDVQTKTGPACKPYSSRFDGIFGVVLPGTSAGYWIPASSSYGISTWVYETTGVQIDSPSLNTVATLISQGNETRRTVFEYPNETVTTCFESPPAYTSKTEEWVDSVSADRKVAVTRYGVGRTDDDTIMVVTKPDGTITREYIAKLTNKAKGLIAGQVRRIENANAQGVALSSTDFEWESTSASYREPRQRAVIENIDPLNRSKRTQFSYDPAFPFQPTVQYHYGYHDATNAADPDLDWSVVTTFVRDSAYLDAHLLVLPRSVVRYSGNPFNSTVVSRTEFGYDTEPATPVGSLIQHLNAYEGGMMSIRGNLTQTTRYVDAAGGSLPVTAYARYDAAGNLIRSFDSTGMGTEYTYDPATFLSLPSKVAFGATDPQSPLRVSASSTYYLGAGLLRSATDLQGRTTQYTYENGPGGWRTKRIAFPDGRSQNYDYFDKQLYVQTYMEYPTPTGSDRTTLRFDGRGQLRKRIGSIGVQSIVDTEYDELRRVKRQSLPYEPGQTPIWTSRSYDALNRVLTQESNGEAKTSFFYDEPRVPPAGVPAYPLQGSTVRTKDAWGHESWAQSDSAGNAKYMVEPNPNGVTDIFGAGNLLTDYQFNPFGQLQFIRSASQVRKFFYDGLGRLTGQALPEREASLDATGVYHGSGFPEFSDVFRYDDRSNLVSRIDARGVMMSYDYCLRRQGPTGPCSQYDPLNRLQQVRYSVSSTGDSSSEILPAPDVTMLYGTGTDLLKTVGAIADGVLTTNLSYDELGRMRETSTTLNAYPTTPLTFTLGYDSNGRNNLLTYPARYFSGNSRRALGFVYRSELLDHVDLNQETLLSNLRFHADGRIKSLTLTTSMGPVNESLDIDPVLGLPSQQTATDANGNRLLALEYRYRLQGVGLGGRTETPGIVGSITAVRDLTNRDLTQDFSYDGLGRLVGASAGDAMSPVFDPVKVSWQQYAYDRFGNRSKVHAFRQIQGRYACPLGCQTVDLDEDHHDGVSSLQFDEKTNRITTSGYAYDSAGNLIRGMAWLNGVYEPRTYKYDAAGRLVQVLAGSNGPLIEAYKYGLGNQRVGASPDGVYWNYFAWLGNKNLAKFVSPTPNVAPVWTEDTFYLGDRRIATEFPQQFSVSRREHLADQRGTSLTVETVNGSPRTTRQGGRPFGTESGSQLDWRDTRRFTSYDRAGPTGLDDAVNRHYDARLGRFLQTDPLGNAAVDIANPRSLNAFVYTQNDPINRIDPTGLSDMVTTVTAHRIRKFKFDFTSPFDGIEVGGSSGESLAGAGPGAAVSNSEPETTCGDKIHEAIEYFEKGMHAEEGYIAVLHGLAVLGSTSAKAALHSPVGGVATAFFGGYALGTGADWVLKTASVGYAQKGLAVFDTGNLGDSFPEYFPPPKQMNYVATPDPAITKLFTPDSSWDRSARSGCGKGKK